MTHRDFGYDVKAWRAFVSSHQKYLWKPLKELTMYDRFTGDPRLDDAVELVQSLTDYSAFKELIGANWPNKAKERQLALSTLKKWTGQDYGFDIPAWEKWFEANLEFLAERPRRSRKK